MKKLLFGFEQEINIGDDAGNPINYIDGKIASIYILQLLQQNPHYKKLIKNGIDIAKPELDASQIEIYNPMPYTQLEQAQEELYECFLLIQGVVQSEGCHILDRVVPKQSFEPAHSGAEDHYEVVHGALLSHSMDARRATNITGTHITLSAGENRIHYRALSQRVRDMLVIGDRELLGCTPERLSLYKKVVSALSDCGVIDSSHVPPLILDESVLQDELLDSYALVRPKQLLSGQQLTELRTVDGPVNAEDVLHKSQCAYEFVMQTI